MVGFILMDRDRISEYQPKNMCLYLIPKKNLI